jgi:hypothetical protein
MDAATELAVLMALRVRGRADAAQVARAAGCAEAEAVVVLTRVQARGAAAPVASGSPALMALTEAGRSELGRLLAAELVDRGALAVLYDRFLVVDRELKQTITAWQLADAACKSAAQAAVMAAAAAAGGVAAALAQIAARLGPYPGRIATAAGAIATGDLRFVASPRVDSLHQVWFELHEDLLLTLGRSRAA